MADDHKVLPQNDIEELLAKLNQRSGPSRWHAWIDIGLKTLIAAAAALGTYYLAVQKQQSDAEHATQVQTNDDIRLVVDLVDGNSTRRSIGIAISKAYAGAGRIPIQVDQAISAFALSTNTWSQSRETNAVTSQIPVGPAPAAAISGQSASKKLPLRIYIQYQRAEDAGAISVIRQKLMGATVNGNMLIVPPTERVQSTIKEPVLKCFKKSECKEYGDDLVVQMKAAGAPSNLALQYVPGFETSSAIRENHFEAWIGPLG